MSENKNNGSEWLKMALLADAVQEVQEEQYEQYVPDEFEDDDDETLEEMMRCAFEALLLNPGCDFGDWQQILIQDYGTEVADAYGSSNPPEVFGELRDLWDAPYYDPNSGLEYDYKEWAEAFATEQSVQMYYDLIDKA